MTTGAQPAAWKFSSQVLVLLIITFLIEFIGLFQPVQAQLQAWLRPVLLTNASLARTLMAPYYRVRHVWNAAARVQDLELRTAEYLAQLSELQHLQRENQALRQLLENSDRTLEQRTIAAPISSYAVPMIAAGSAEQVASGDLVVAQNTLIGRVSEVSAHQAQVVLFSNSQSQPLLVETDKGVRGVVMGDDLSVLLTNVARDQQLAVGDRVVTVGQPGVRPGLFVGTVVALRTTETAPVQTAVVEQLVSFYEAPVVEVW